MASQQTAHVVVLVDLDDGFRMMSQLFSNADAADLDLVGRRVKVVVADRDGSPLPYVELEEDGDG